MAGFYAGDSAVSMPYSVAEVFVSCAQLASRGSATQRAALMRASVYQLAVANSAELAPMDPRLAAKDGGMNHCMQLLHAASCVFRGRLQAKTSNLCTVSSSACVRDSVNVVL